MKKTHYPRLGETLYRDTLPNGLPVVVLPRPGFRKKLCYLVTGYGSVHQDFTRGGEVIHTPAGVAHFLEHKLFDLPGRDISQEFAALGASVNAFTTYDMTAYYFSCTAHFPQNLRLLLEMVSAPCFTQESVDKEQGIIGQEIAMNLDSPDTRIFENLMAAMYENHPIKHPILGTEGSIGEITPEVLTQCHRAFYSAGNLLLCVIGDVDPQEVAEIAGAVPFSREAVTPQEVWPEPEGASVHQVTTQMDVAIPMFQLGFKCPGPGKGEAGIRREIVADLAAEALFGESSPLYLELYQKGLIDTSFGGGFETVSGMAMLTASGDSKDPEAVQEAIFREARRLCREGLEPGAFLRMKRSALGRRIRSLDSFDSTCFRLCAYYFSGYDYFRFPELYETIQEEELYPFLAEAVTEERCCLSLIEPIGGRV